MIIMMTITTTTINIIMVIIVGVEGINKAWLWTNPLICGHGLEHKDHGRRDNVQKHTCCFTRTPNDWHNVLHNVALCNVLYHVLNQMYCIVMHNILKQNC